MLAEPARADLGFVHSHTSRYPSCADEDVECRPDEGAMVKEGTPGKYKLRALQEGSRQPLIEAYASRDEVDARKAALERAGYTVIVRLAETVREVLASRVQHSRQGNLSA